ncbi:Rieske 2Fe-2S domain-containing protein [Streptomyces sp. HU2014]|uniref:(2Fe-2S)-binding protein n=1 Tax=Streptomyces albireticuli TaxID=1940 RepID=A0A1Z2KVI4_9ACTN|nr:MULTISPECIES: Rieske 2Fe-2S domain-containing protein [Streptomyces]ARZ66067.1 (2Fe-2S)-binding protein [Streptomyces albireticuli]UQI46324.1 Rieske 2Fe-2S domain-containing protein [Streptomyces sp. HU2014]
MKQRRRRPRPYDRELQSLRHPVGPERQGPVPVGWYFARFSRHLRRGEVVPVTYLAREYALFRTRGGQVGMIDSQCCHMGADLSRCGRVSEERLVCGFHAWEFGTDGTCRKIPGAGRVPSRAVQSSVPVTELGGIIWFWHGSPAPEPMDELAFAEDHRRHMYLGGEVLVCHADLLPIGEHVTDAAHWAYTHSPGRPMVSVQLTDEGRRFAFRIQPADADDSRIHHFRPYTLISMASPTTAVATPQPGPRAEGKPPRMAFIAAVSPVRPGVTLATWGLVVRKLGPDVPFWPVNRLWAAFLARLARHNHRADFDILRWMRPVARDLWSAADGPTVRAYRRFYRRNLPPAAEEPVAEGASGKG